MLLTWAEYCAFTGTDPVDTTDQARVEKLIESATAQAEAYCRRSFTVEERTIVDLWRSAVTLKAIPVTAVKIYLDRDAVFGPATEVTSGYFVDWASGIVRWLVGIFPGVPMKVIYTGGLDTVPPDLKEAIFKIVKWDSARIFSGQVGIRSVVSGEITTNFDTAMPYEVRQTLDLYGLP